MTSLRLVSFKRVRTWRFWLPTYLPRNGNNKTTYSSFLPHRVINCSIVIFQSWWKYWLICSGPHIHIRSEFLWCCLKHCLISDCILNKGICFPYTDISLSPHTFKSMHCLWVLKDWFDEMHMENSTHFEVTYLWFNGVSNQSNNRVSIVRS